MGSDQRKKVNLNEEIRSTFNAGLTQGRRWCWHREVTWRKREVQGLVAIPPPIPHPGGNSLSNYIVGPVMKKEGEETRRVRVAEKYGRRGGNESKVYCKRWCDVWSVQDDFTEISTVVLNFMLLPFAVNYSTENCLSTAAPPSPNAFQTVPR